MGKLKCNIEELNNLNSKLGEIYNSLVEAQTSYKSFSEAAISYADGWPSDTDVRSYVRDNVIYKNNEGNSKYGYYHELENESKEWRWHSHVVDSEAVEYINGCVSAFKGGLAAFKFDDVDAIVENVGKLKDDVNSIYNLISDFDNTTFSLKEAMVKLGKETGSLQWYNVDGEKYSDGDDSSDYNVVMVSVGVDENGNEIYVTLSEAVNCFYTEQGISVDSTIALASLAGSSEDVDLEVLNEEMLAIINQTHTTVGNYAEQGYYAVASQQDIEDMYKAATGLEYDQETLDKDYNSILSLYAGAYDENELNAKLLGSGTASLVGPMAMLGAISNAITEKGKITDPDNKNFSKDQIEKSGLSDYKDRTEERNAAKEAAKDQEEDVTAVDRSKDKGSGLSDSSDDEFGSFEPISGGDEDGTTEIFEGIVEEKIDPIPGVPPDSLQTDYEASRIQDTISEMSEIEMPQTIDQATRTPEEIDLQARDEFFAENADTLREERQAQIDEYNAMSDDQKASALKNFGYSEEEVVTLIAAPAAGQTAYVYGKFNESLANTSNQIAAAEGIDNFVSDYTNKNTIENLQNKTANVDLSTTSKTVQQARQQLTTAKANYDNSVTKANEEIDKANKARKNYDQVLKKIQDANGDDPKKWTDEQVDEYNEAASDYNDAVESAKRAADDVEKAKETYNKEKADYEETYEKWRDETEGEIDKTLFELGQEEAPTVPENNSGDSGHGVQVGGNQDELVIGDSTSGTSEENTQSTTTDETGSSLVIDDSGLSISGDDDSTPPGVQGASDINKDVGQEPIPTTDGIEYL